MSSKILAADMRPKAELRGARGARHSTWLVSAAVVLAGISATPAAAAVTYSLANDFSEVNNPNGVWSFTQGTTLLSHYAQPTDGNNLNAAAANGYWGVGPAFNKAPIVIQTSQNGSATPSYSNNDFLAGDVIAHSTNPGAGDQLFINWTAPSAGTISFSSAVWYAHSPVSRSNDISDILAGNLLNTVAVNDTITRSKALTTLSGSSLNVAAGDVLAFRLTPTAGETFGSLAGISETVDFTAMVPGVPEPTTWALMLLGFGGLGAALRARRRAALA